MNLKINLMALTIMLITGFSACLPDDSNDPNPSDPREKFLGEWKVAEDCRRMNYTVTITPDGGNTSQVLIENFGNPGPGYDAAVGLVVSNSLYVNSQTIGEGWTVSGKGTYQADGSVSWDYTLIISGSQLDCTAGFTR